MRTRLYLILPVAVLAVGPVMAGSSALAAGAAAPAARFELIPQVVPQYNNPGPQVALPETSNPLLQQAPLGTTSPPTGGPVVQLPPLGTTTNPLEQPPLAGTTVP